MHRILFQIGPFTLYSYGLSVAAAFLLSAGLILRNAKRFGIQKESVFDLLIAILVGGLVGGRLLFAVINWGDFREAPLRAFMIWEGGLAFHGALILGALSGIVAASLKKLPLWKTADLIVPYVALAQAVGRIGCFLNGCCYGRIIEKGIGVTFPGETVLRMPVQLYSSLGLFIIFLILITLREKRPFEGSIFSLYLVLYSFFRFFMDFLRGDELVTFFGVTLSQAISASVFICGAVIFTALLIRSKNKRYG